jgi:putative FmdB family regulatory protein
MPIYEYRCDNGHTFETLQRMSDDALDTCEVCEAPAVRVLHAPAVHFKGSGFYNTDYGTKKRARELRSAGEGRASDASKNGDGGSRTATSDTSKASSGSDAPKKPDSSSKKSDAA